MSSVDIAKLRTWIGREQHSTEILSSFPARALAAALGHRRVPYDGDELPMAWHWLYFLETPKATGVDGHALKGQFLPPVPLPRRMWAGGAVDIVQPVRLGVAAEKRSTIRSVNYKSGRSGELVFVSIDHQILQAGALCIREEQTLVFRGMPTAATLPIVGEPATAIADWSQVMTPDPVLLFRYSALTYNSHRIHYDRNFAMNEESYPGLVVHAPLLVTLMLELLAAQNLSVGPKTLRFRALSPTFDLLPFSLHGRRDGRHVNLWSADADNRLGMSAIAAMEEAP